MVPVWIVSEQWRPLNPPAEVRVLGASRSTANLLAATQALKVREARRYQPGGGVTWCNIYLADVLDILAAGIPHLWNGHELRANDIVDGLRAGTFPGWSRVADGLSAANRAATGLPTIAVWKNVLRGPDGKPVIGKDGKEIPKGPGHVMIVVPAPPGTSGVHVTGAGEACHEQCPLAAGFGSYAYQVEFYGHD